MQRITRLLGIAVAGTAALATVPLLGSGGAVAARFTGGNLVVYRVGDGAAALSNAAAPVFVDEYTATGAKVQSIPLPTASANGNSPLTATGLSRSEGQIARSADGRFVTVTGYAAAPGTTGPGGLSLTASPPTSVGRVVGIIDANGAVDSSTVLHSAGAPKIIRSAVSSAGDRIWVAGGNGGVLTTVLGSGTAAVVAGSATSNLNGLTIQGGQLFSSGILTDRLSKIGAGAPAVASTPTALAGLPSNLLTNGYAFLDLTGQGYAGTALDTLYIANASQRGGTVDKYTFNGTAWNRAGDVNVEGVSGLVADNHSGTVTLAVTTPTQLLTLTDLHGGDAVFTPAAPTVLATASAGQEFRGVALAPVAATGPSLYVRRPVTSSSTSQGSAGVAVSALVTAPSGVASVKAKLGNGTYRALVKGSGNVWSATLPVNAAKPGATTVTVVATDKASQVTQVTKSLTITALVAPKGTLGPKTWSFRTTLVKKHGTWRAFTYRPAPGHRGLTAKVKTANVAFTVYGRSLVLTFRTRPDAGKVKVTVGGRSHTLDLYAKKPGKLVKTFVFTTTGAAAPHGVRISPTGAKRPASHGTAAFLGYFRVTS